jgi:D-glycero-D-manno-heptose 1,7-bisphosphate phosphatase
MNKKNDKKEIVVLVGIPGCGKSTFVERFLPYHRRVNLDSIHALLDPVNGFDKKNLGLARNIESLMIEESMLKGVPVVIDNTNISEEKRSKYIEYARKHDADMVAVYFEPDLKKALKQNSERERKVPKMAIIGMLKKYEPPRKEEGFLRVVDANNPVGLLGERPAVFLDRDGVILNPKDEKESKFIRTPADIAYIRNALPGLRKMSEQGFDIVIVSNQAGVGLGYLTLEKLAEIDDKIKADLEKGGVNLKGIYNCVDRTDAGCLCRKPATGLIIKASQEHNLDPAKSYMIGDMTSDIELGKRVHANTILVETGFGGSDKKYDAVPDFKAKDLVDAAAYMAKRS